MQGGSGRAAGALIPAALALALLAGCGRNDGDPQLLNISNGGKPDEFTILPTKPLQAPPDFQNLPPPTPGGSNLTDPTPEADAVAALGGKPSALEQPVSRADGALLSHAGRYGTDPGIRTELAAADLQWRREHTGKFLERLFKVNVYFRAYEMFELDQYAELARLRRAGVKTPAVPPDPAKQ